jgi:hypothetical protein
MKKILLMAGIISMMACTKEECPAPAPVPVKDYSTWMLTIDGEPMDHFRITLYSSVIPFREVDYTAVLCCGVSPMKINMVIGQTYAVKYMGADSVLHLITHVPQDANDLYDTIPATTF